MLLLFVAIFSVILMLGAFAVDQGLWLAKRRVSQKDADVAARGGAIALLISATAPQGDPAGSSTGGCDAGSAVAGANLVAGGNVDCTQAAHCLTNSDGMPSVAVTIHRPVLGLFSRLPLVNQGISGVIDTAASATACIGTTTRLAIGADAPQAAPIVLDQRDTDPNSCFSNAQLVYGKECVVFGTADSGSGSSS
ncbi:MAG TPA: hypothetical protein VEZ14_05010, partial [Dehalococcoidia bacterium]|nr:hypothetical protein [Dehalococcoidia bacterium]